MGDLAEAIATLDAACLDAPEAPGRRGNVGPWRREAALHERMSQAIGDRFTVLFEGPSQERLGLEALASLDRAYWRIGAVLGVLPSQPISVVLYTTEQFRDITRTFVGSGCL